MGDVLGVSDLVSRGAVDVRGVRGRRGAAGRRGEALENRQCLCAKAMQRFVVDFAFVPAEVRWAGQDFFLWLRVRARCLSWVRL